MFPWLFEHFDHLRKISEDQPELPTILQRFSENVQRWSKGRLRIFRLQYFVKFSKDYRKASTDSRGRSEDVSTIPGATQRRTPRNYRLAAFFMARNKYQLQQTHKLANILSTTELTISNWMVSNDLVLSIQKYFLLWLIRTISGHLQIVRTKRTQSRIKNLTVHSRWVSPVGLTTNKKHSLEFVRLQKRLPVCKRKKVSFHVSNNLINLGTS